MKSVRRNPLTIAALATVLLLGFTLTKSGKPQSTKTQKRDSSQELIEATRNGGLKEAARIKNNFVSSERSSGWAKYDLEGLTKNSSLIVIGTPILTTSKLSDSGQQILTEHQVRVEQTLKGTIESNHVLTVTVIGGKVTFEDGTTAEIRTPDLGPINTGKTYVFFLRKHKMRPLITSALPEEVRDFSRSLRIQRVRRTYVSIPQMMDVHPRDTM